MNANPEAQIAVPSPILMERSLHLIDVENLARTATLTSEMVASIRSLYIPTADVVDGDHVVIATSHHGALGAWMGWGGNPRRLVSSGPDGADHCLLRVLDNERVAERFDRVVIASGDGIFSMAAARLQAAGVRVTIVAPPSGLSSRLRLAALDIRFIEPLPLEVAACAKQEAV